MPGVFLSSNVLDCFPVVQELMDEIVKQVSLLGLRCITDSQVALFCIHGTDKKWKLFVRNRVAEIRRLVPPNCWSHCSGETNSADLPSRGLTLLELSVSGLWRNGLEWLSTKLTSPEEINPANMPEECASEMKIKSQPAHNRLTPNSKLTIGEIMDCQDHSTMSRLLRCDSICSQSCEKIQVWFFCTHLLCCANY